MQVAGPGGGGHEPKTSHLVLPIFETITSGNSLKTEQRERNCKWIK